MQKQQKQTVIEIHLKQADPNIVKQQIKIDKILKEELVQTLEQKFHIFNTINKILNKIRKKPIFYQVIKKLIVAFFVLIILLLIGTLIYNFNRWIATNKFSKKIARQIMIHKRNQQILNQLQQENNLKNQKISDKILKTKGSFSVYIQKQQNISLRAILKHEASKVQMQIVGLNKLQYLVSKWNSQNEILTETSNKFSNQMDKQKQYKTNKIKYKKKINLQNIHINDKQMLLVFLKLYYQAGTFVGFQVLAQNFQNKCLRLTIFDFDILFIQTKQILENDIRVPDFRKMIRVKYPNTPMIRRMIENIIDNKSYDQQCRQRQCLIVKCIQSPQTSNQLKAVKQFAQQNSKFNLYNYSHYVVNDTIKYQKQYQIKDHIAYSISNLISFDEAVDVRDQQQYKSSIYEWSNRSSQIFQFFPQDNIGRKFKIYSPIYNKIMKIQNGSCNNGARIIFGDQKGQPDQVWEFVPIQQADTNNYQINNLNYYFYIKSFCGKYIKVDRPDIFINQNRSIILFDYKGQYHQAWFIYPAYNPQYQYNNVQQYEQSYIDSLYHLPSVVSYSQVIARKIQYLKLKIKIFREQVPFWIHIPDFFPQPTDVYTESSCAKRHQITYIWLGQKELPIKYQSLINKCQDKARLLGELDFAYYTKLWNDQIDDLQFLIVDEHIKRFMTRVTLLKFLFLYFQSGIYSDFDTQINQQCFENIYTQDIIWTNTFFWQIYGVILNPQQNFMKVDQKYHPTVKFFIQMLISSKYGNERWRQCRTRQCLIVHCQRHQIDNTWK